MEHDGVYPRGSVKKVRVTDLMSFVGTLELVPGPRVNLITGPNGSGKSSLVTALCVGLAGGMKTLGRQKDASELIRRGCSAFEVEVTLSGGPGQPDIRVHRRTEALQHHQPGERRQRRPPPKRQRTSAQQQQGGAGGSGPESEDEDVDADEPEGEEEGEGGGRGGGGRGRGHSQTTWRLDGRVVPEARVKDLTRELGIYFDNLCQFLPQERVSEFAALSAVELLENTEKVIGDGHLLRTHMQLVERSKALRAKREDLTRTRDRLAKVQADQAAAEPEYRRLRRRDELKEEVKRIRQKLLWVEKQAKEAAVRRAQQALTAAAARVTAAQREVQQAQAPLTAHNQDKERLDQAVSGRVRAITAQAKKVEAARGQLVAAEAALKQREEELQGLKAKSDRWRAEVTRCQEGLRKVEAEQQTAPTGISPQQAQRLEQIAGELQAAAGEVGGAGAQVDQKQHEVAAIQRDVQRLETAEQRRADRREALLRKLEGAQSGSRALVDWLAATRGQGGFVRRVLGPVLLEMSPVADAGWAGYLEQVIGRRGLCAVVTEHIEDNNKVQAWLMANRCTHQLICVRNGAQPVTHPDGEPAAYTAAYGITHTLDQLFEAPDLIKTALCNANGINTFYVGDNRTHSSQVFSALLSNTSVTRVFTPQGLTVATRSYYDRSHVMQSLEYLKPARLLAQPGAAGGEAEEQQERDVLEQRRRELEEAKRELARLQSELATRKAAADALQRERHQLLQARQRIQTRLKELERDASDFRRQLQRRLAEGDPMAAMRQLSQRLAEEVDRFSQQAAALADQVRQQHVLHRQLAPLQLQAAEMAARRAPLQRAYEAAAERLAADTRGRDAAQHALEAAKQVAQEAAALAREELGGAAAPDPELAAAWAGWPNEAAALEALMSEKTADMEAAQANLRGDEAAVLRAWSEREKELREEGAKAAAYEADVDKTAQEVEALKASWLPELQGHVAAVNEALRRNFASIGCAGEVALREDGDAFESYAAEIRVEYRPGEGLRALDRNHHSGGERSVATMLYLIALQGVTRTPFRVVDEINQGMDSRNERKVFNLLVESSSRPDTPQCFLLTPKLIANLQYNEHVRVHDLKPIRNGSIVMPPGLVDRLLQQAAAEREAAAAAAAAGGEGQAAAAHHARRGVALAPRQRTDVSLFGLGQLPWNLLKDFVVFRRAAAEQN
ncbi:hypothetical protein HYH02_006192 [Chlamydomonas schloesseri]|uniref:Structural maintenance of chromosomes protein 5 n=1 Tax=Chlamydomonas schloesseri TaxID=2026947 RepID=A0A835WK13_9CHLO|nr:hypothetical protein HYH02_006192 [Chlamydomonas schloesseri]|eukprot:KAG2448841.1 hypothetical protein HYH02_006192 [Chlamydomonas schloesseri]